MLLFQDNKSSFLDLREAPFKLEKEIQQLKTYFNLREGYRTIQNNGRD